MFPRYDIQIAQSNQGGSCTAVVVRGCESGCTGAFTGPSVMHVLTAAVDHISELERPAEVQSTEPERTTSAPVGGNGGPLESYVCALCGHKGSPCRQHDDPVTNPDERNTNG